MHGRPWKSLLATGMLVVTLGLPAVLWPAGEQAPPSATVSDCPALAAQIAEDHRRLREELRQVKRELALLNQNLDKPGVREIIAGIGGILGVFGVAALVSSRRRNAQEDRDAHR